jgi:hypothetical protein
MAMPEHLRRNHERTDDALSIIYGLAACLEILELQSPPAERTPKEELAESTVKELLITKLAEVNRLRRFEWAGIGGNSYELTSDEIAASRGQETEASKANIAWFEE